MRLASLLKVTISKRHLFLIIILFVTTEICFAQTESVTLTTYYPSPHGVYSSLLADRFGVGDNNGDGNLNSSDVPTTAGEVWISGNVGIQTQTPAVALDVNGDIDANNATISNNLTVNNNLTTQDELVNDTLTIRGDLILPSGRPLIVNNAPLIVHPVNYPQPWGSVYVSMGEGAGGTYYDGVYAQPNLHIESAGRIVFLTGGNNGRGEISATGKWTINGDLEVQGNLIKPAGSFVIDHPLDPKNKILRHSLVESPQMMNIYKGRAKLKDGTAEVNLPRYFSALNDVSDSEVYLTCVNGWSPLYFIGKFEENKFIVKTTSQGNPEQEFSWAVYTVRKDAYARKHPIIVEEVKGEGNSYKKGEYIHPEAFEN